MIALHTENGLEYEVTGVWAQLPGTRVSRNKPVWAFNSPHPDLAYGVYRHYKGCDYLLLRPVIDWANGNWLILYQALYGEKKLFLRPAHMWSEIVGEVPRFAFIGAPSEEKSV